MKSNINKTEKLNYWRVAFGYLINTRFYFLYAYSVLLLSPLCYIISLCTPDSSHRKIEAERGDKVRNMGTDSNDRDTSHYQPSARRDPQPSDRRSYNRDRKPQPQDPHPQVRDYKLGKEVVG